MKKAYWYRNVRIPDSIISQGEKEKEFGAYCSQYGLQKAKDLAEDMLDSLHETTLEEYPISKMGLLLMLRASNMHIIELPNPASEKFFRMLDEYVLKAQELEYNFNYKGKGEEE